MNVDSEKLPMRTKAGRRKSSVRPYIRVTGLAEKSPVEPFGCRAGPGPALRRLPGRQAGARHRQPAPRSTWGRPSGDRPPGAASPLSPLGAGRASHNSPGPTGGELRSASLRTRRGTRSGAGGQRAKENGGAPLRAGGGTERRLRTAPRPGTACAPATGASPPGARASSAEEAPAAPRAWR
ncbi:uncharacterized protein MISP3 [Passer montanus]|uniref:uncharacterized protein MISP3 n=1 Tax=Passer montanus TaxID=9160 RepID=UPI0019607BDB|nr:uncharacterized protein MISP3 [Passer montanus]